jgi:hypothetical protein
MSDITPSPETKKRKFDIWNSPLDTNIELLAKIKNTRAKVR